MINIERNFVALLMICSISFISSAQNPTDGCAGVQVLAVNAACTPAGYTLPGTYANGTLNAASCQGGQNRDDGWYSVTAAANGTMSIDVTGNQERTLSVWTVCGAGVELACDNQASGTTASVSFAATMGSTYFVQVHRNSGNNTASMAGTVCAYLVPTPATCTDGIQNGGETGIDCGGPCPACPTCSDGIQNGGETGVDCGGPCPACPPSCSDGIQNGTETGIDCGGSCPPCAAAIITPACSNVTYNLTSLQTRAFYDDGGNGGDPCGDGTALNYCNCNCMSTTTICAAPGEFIVVDFSEFAMWNTTSGWDWMKIYDGPNTASPILYDNSSTGADNPFGDCGIGTAPMEFCSSGQCMTFEFWATSVVNRAGWAANVSSVAVACVFLPIELESFTASCNDDGALLEWRTASESENDFFSIERSFDGISYSPIEVIQGAGNSTKAIDYRYLDTDDVNGVRYYRLKQTDFNGEYSYSNIASADCGASVRIYPNPTTDDLTIEFLEKVEGTIQVSITDVLGATIFEVFEIENSSNSYKLSRFGDLGSGVYTVRISDKNGEIIKMEKVVKN